MTDNKIIGAFKRLLTMTLALVMVLGSAMPLVTQEVSAFNGKVGSKYTVHWYKELHYGPGEGGYSNATVQVSYIRFLANITNQYDFIY